MNRQEFCESAQQLFRDIEKGAVSVELVEGGTLQGKVKYQTSNGWTIVVFSDGDDWDYISLILPPSGQHLKLWPEQEILTSCGPFAPIIFQPVNSLRLGDSSPNLSRTQR